MSIFSVLFVCSFVRSDSLAVTAIMKYKYTINKSEQCNANEVYSNDFISCDNLKKNGKMMKLSHFDGIKFSDAKNILILENVTKKWHTEKELSTIDINSHTCTHIWIQTTVSAVRKMRTITRMCVNTICVYLLQINIIIPYQYIPVMCQLLCLVWFVFVQMKQFNCFMFVYFH